MVAPHEEVVGLTYCRLWKKCNRHRTRCQGLVGGGVERKHPSADFQKIVKGHKIGNILGKKLRLAGVYFTDQNKCEMWTKLEGGQWDKGMEGTNIGL